MRDYLRHILSVHVRSGFGVSGVLEGKCICLVRCSHKLQLLGAVSSVRMAVP